MILIVTGGSGSGKSSYAESRVTELPASRRIYLATMQVLDDESRERVKRHVAARRGKGFETLECPAGIGHLTADVSLEGATVLLEDLSNLLANEMFAPGADPLRTPGRILEDLTLLSDACTHLVVVTNEVFSDGAQYDDAGTLAFCRGLGFLNSSLARMADEVVEVVCGIPVFLKGRGGCHGDGPFGNFF